MEKNNNYIFYSELALPYLESNEKVIEKIFKNLQNKFNLVSNSNQRFIDLGAGDGTVIIHSALRYNIESVGIEIKPSLINECNNRIDLLKENSNELQSRLQKVKMIQGDLFQQTLESFDFVYIFSLPTMQRFLNHVFRTARKGAIFISYKYPLEDFPYLNQKDKMEIRIKDKNVCVYFYNKQSTNS